MQGLLEKELSFMKRLHKASLGQRSQHIEETETHRCHSEYGESQYQLGDYNYSWNYSTASIANSFAIIDVSEGLPNFICRRS